MHKLLQYILETQSQDSEVSHLLYIGTDTEANEICTSKVSEEAYTENIPYAKQVLLAAM